MTFPKPLAVVLLPGMDGTGRMFSGLAQALGIHARTIVVSYPPQQALGYRELEEFVRRHLPNGEPFILLAESFSGPIALSLASTKPAGLVGLILCCTFARNPLPWLRYLRGLAMHMPMSFQPIRLLSPWLFGRMATPTLRDALRMALADISADTLRARLVAVLDADYSHVVPHIAVPMLYLQAANDRIVPPSATRHLQALAPHMRVHTLAGPHLLLQVKPDETAAVIEDFVRAIVNTL
jgi:pimeloyl-ACP methyl ester carboxylesterase